MTTQEPIVSIILPTFNRANYLRSTLLSILQQKTNYPYEILVVDDHSSDNTADVVSRISDKRITFIALTTRHGGGGARNKGISAANGRYIAFIDSDVTWKSNKLETQVSFLESNPSISCVYSKYIKITPEKKKKILPNKIYNTNTHQELLKDNFIDTPTAIVRKSALENIKGFDASLPRFQDWELFLRLSLDHSLFGMETPLIESLDLPDSISRNIKSRKEALEIIFHKHKDKFMKDQSALFIMSAKIVYANLALGLRNDAKKFYSEIQKDLSLGRRIALYVLTYAPLSLVERARQVKRRIM